MKRVAGLLGFLVLAGLASGQEKSLDLNDLVRRALERNPGIKSLESSARAAKFGVGPAGALPDPVVGLGVMNAGIDRWTVGQAQMSQVVLSVSQSFPFPGKLRLESEIASSRALQAEQTLGAARLSLVREVKDLYARLFFYQKSLEILGKRKALLVDALRASEKKYEVGAGVQADLFRAQVEISGIEKMEVTTNQMVVTTKANINELLDLPDESPLGPAGEIPFYALATDLDTLQRQADKSSPLLKNADLSVSEGETEVSLAKKEFYPNFMVQVGRGFRGALPDIYEVMVGVEIPLYQKKKQANLLEESVSRLSGAKTQRASIKNGISYMITDNYTAARASSDLLVLYKDKILPQARFAYESSLANYPVNRVDFLTLLSDINNLFTYETEYYRNLSDLWTSVARLEELTSLDLLSPGGRETPATGGGEGSPPRGAAKAN
jgi:cobalt-zinc-cadmium efflux system outer membrane protein